MNLEHTITECLDTLELAAKAKNNRLELKYEPSSSILYSDAHRIKQVLLNFLTNSIKFTSNGIITVVVDDLPSTKRITVNDTGAGISP